MVDGNFAWRRARKSVAVRASSKGVRTGEREKQGSEQSREKKRQEEAVCTLNGVSRVGYAFTYKETMRRVRETFC